MLSITLIKRFLYEVDVKRDGSAVKLMVLPFTKPA